MKKVIKNICLVFAILILTTTILADTAQISLDGNQVTSLAQTIKALEGCPTQSNEYFFYGNFDIPTKDKICFYANFTNHPTVSNKKMISASYISTTAEENAFFASYPDNGLLKWENLAWTCMEGSIINTALVKPL